MHSEWCLVFIGECGVQSLTNTISGLAHQSAWGFTPSGLHPVQLDSLFYQLKPTDPDV